MAATTSPLQLAANRANSQLSTGPKTAAGKLSSSRNSRSHGLTARAALLPSEDPAAYQLHHQSWVDYYCPQDPISSALVTDLVDIEWRLRRVPAFEAQLLSLECLKLTSDHELEPLFNQLTSDDQILALAFSRLIQSKVLLNLQNQEARLARRADKIRRRLDQTLLEPDIPIQKNENRKNEANQPPSPMNAEPPAPPATPLPPAHKTKIGRNEACPCLSGLKFKRCCLNKPATAAPVRSA